MNLFETERLVVRSLSAEDADDYFDMNGNPNVMRLIPREAMSREDSDKHLQNFLDTDYARTDTKVYAIEAKGEKEFVGLAGMLKNNKGEDEIAYRLREKYWRRGLGTEIAEGLIEYVFFHMKTEVLTADVYVENRGSVKILEKFMTMREEFFNPSDNCTDRRYELQRSDWETVKLSSNRS
ncbi:GNAT family N-acetyltransferase [Aureibacter tunicatorum]|uniref:Ribosomal-protein-alanine N-acetyltransferase n=1 Tax=Aureibacter tunicatorum TaxID=866807 RepID=A0AAE3XS84_9BACT|nr:GNAT family N-acetyltransferase [Aureibacter tunicatorum]MDR6241148.1 ribosomal-protein-alanine N-acetyltransferase [Aureibacter tunicatorum]BDD03925.1 GNAT family acetyltransferase [Aureibacter tunicatorum]